ncbi:MAG: DUF4276 family protein [Chloroflexi bacterium]|nr:DUF4276 family protein [Chloroflexota bacterium]
MTSIYIICEGRTESTVVKNILGPELAVKDVYFHPVRIGRRRRGGNVTFDRLEMNIRDQLLNNRNWYCTTLIDFYGIEPDFPGKKEAATKSELSDKLGVVCDAFADKLAQTLDEGPMRRFIPYVQMHEFEGLLFSDPMQLAFALRRQELAQQFWAIRNDFDTPEHIDDSPISAPSKRIQQMFPRYRKVQMGERAIRAITLEKIRDECPLFDAWLAKLENLPALPA